ncbi:hypothetical protein N1F89_00215 [Aquibium sp. A9E412]|uniref:hypothetical protein n=1 Tax=Aquibium sp. A9E412 TaxID=2976767 RepID=UPI0025B0B388|nr:hypothetical protein [Aquibium sp. A9E412]MDN2564636.1 hypothetical protein [Aquibium sp. A9E412]
MTDKELLNCFRRDPNGMWRSVQSVQISGPNGSVGIGPGMSFSRGAAFMGLNLAAELDRLAAVYGEPPI